MSTVAVSTFLSTLRRSNLLKPEQIAFAIDLGTRCDTAEISKELLERNWLTEWQAHQILAGKSRLFLGRYKLLDVLGSGGMGAVFKAESSTLRRPVALKVLSASLNDSEIARARFEREIRASAQVNHPNIVRAIDADHCENRVFLVMEYFQGPDLKALLKQHKRLPIEFACECIRQAALGLQHAHEQRLVHRDIKPSNLLVTRNPETGEPLVKVLDLGLARIATDSSVSSDMTRAGQIMGSPDYMSPEQAMDSRSADHRADIYSLGVTLFHLISGELPYDGDNVMEKLLSRINVDAPPLSRYCPEAPPILVHIVARMLHRDPTQRFQTAGEVAAILGTFVANPRALEAVVAQPQTPVFEVPTISTAVDETLHQIDAMLDSRAHSTPFVHNRRPRKKSSLLPVAISIGTATLLIGGLLLAGLGTKGASQKKTGSKEVASKSSSATSSFPMQDSGPAPRPGSPDDVVTRWSLAMGRAVVILDGDNERTVRNVADLPANEYHLLEVDLAGVRELDGPRIEQLAGATSLRRLNLSGAELTDRRLETLAALTNLEVLDLSSTSLSERSSEVLATMPKLRKLSLRYLPLGDTQLEGLADLPQLTMLDLAGTSVTDRGLQTLAKSPTLKTLSIQYTAVTAGGLRKLLKARPDLTIN
ncbi:protein kinase [bacterium]|nr:protein kinase [bacterium]